MTNSISKDSKESNNILLELVSRVMGQHSSLTPHIIQVISNILDGDPSLPTGLVELHQLALLSGDGGDKSGAGEREILERLVHELNITNGYVVDIAASDGYTQSCTLGLFGRAGWEGLAVELDPIKFYKLAYLYSKFPNARLARSRVTPGNIVDLLKAYEVRRDFDVLNVDIDSYDLYVIDSMLSADFRPKVITMEINEKIPGGVYFTVDFHEEHFWQQDHFFGCSVDAACETVKRYGYILWKIQYNNAIFIRSDIAPPQFKDERADRAYMIGYKNQPDRQDIFPWNSDVDHWLDLTPQDAIVEIAEYFKSYSGNFTLRLSSQTLSKESEKSC